MELNVMTFNIHHGKGTDGKLDLERIVQVMKESKADIIGINEVDRHFSKRSDYQDQVSYLAKELQMYATFGATFTRISRGSVVPREFGNAVLSRFPIVSEQNHLFDFYAGIIEGRAVLEVSLQIDQQLANIFITHLSLNPILHKKQTNFMIQKIEQRNLPMMILGDWNMRPKATAWKRITHYLTDVSEVVDRDSLHTFPSSRPKTQLDYIFVSNEFHIASANTVDHAPTASDHLPLMATLILE